MRVRDVTSKSIQLLAAMGLIWVVGSCKGKPEPVAGESKSKLVGPGGAASRLQVTTGGTVGSSASAPSLPQNKLAVSLDNITAFSAASKKSIKVPYDGELLDEQNQFDVKKHRFTAAAARSYNFCASLASLTKDFDLDLYVNGARENTIASARLGIAQGCRTIMLKAGEYAEVWVEQSSGAPMAFAPNAFWNWLSVNPLDGSASLDNIKAFTAETATFTKVPYSAALYNVDKQFDEQAGRYTAATPGDYRVCASLTSGAKDFELDLAISGSRENAFAVASHGTASGCRTVRLAQGQFVEVWVRHETGAPMAFAPNQSKNWMTVDKLAATDATLAVSLDNNSAFAAPPNTFTKVPYVNVLYDTQKQFSLQTNRFTTTTPRDYLVCASLASLAQDFELNLYVNGVREKAIAMSNIGVGQGCRAIRLKKAGDFVEVWVHQNSATPINFATNQFWNWMTIHALSQL
jgi:hypothetical protein